MGNWMKDCLTPEEAKAYIGQEMEFRLYDSEEWVKGTLTQVSKCNEIGGYPFESDQAVWFTFCRLPKQPKIKRVPWTPETAPAPLMVRRKDWTKGCYAVFNVGKESIYAQVELYDEPTELSYTYLAETGCPWETRDGKPCCDEIEVDDE